MATAFLPQPAQDYSAFGLTLPPVQRLDSQQPGVSLPAPQAAQPAMGTLPKPTESPWAKPVAAAQGGLQAGQLGTQAYDGKSAAVAIGGAAAAGALAGAPAGPVGAAVGGIVGGGVAALQAWLAVGANNREKRRQRKLLSEAKAEQNVRDKLARSDSLDQLAYDRDSIEEAKAADRWAKMKDQIAQAHAAVKNRRTEYLEKGFVT